MLLAIDAGNTNFTFAVFSEAAMAQSWRVRTEPGRTADEYAAWFSQLLALHGLKLSDIDAAIISSVVPDANFNLLQFCRKTLKVEALLVGDPTVDLGLTVNIDRPSEVGADRLVNAVAVLRDYKPPAIVIDFGTATTFDVINAKGEYSGGAIAPGIDLSMKALHMAAAKLPRITVRKPQSVIGRDTVGAMQSGVFWGYAGLIEGMVRRMGEEMGGKPLVIATGGLASLFAGQVDCINKTDNDLTLRGLLYIYERNIGNQDQGKQ
jgi:type III pantothenate kinase